MFICVKADNKHVALIEYTEGYDYCDLKSNDTQKKDGF